MSRRRRKKLPAEPVILDIEGLSHEGRGVAHLDGKTVFVAAALPGERASCQYTRQRGRFDEAKAVDILQAAPERVEPVCEHAQMCGGCSLQHMHTDAQIRHKQATMLELVQHAAGVQPDEVLPPLTGPVTGYRRKARLGVRYVLKKETMLVGFREKSSGFLADIKSCKVMHPLVGERLMLLREMIGGLQAYQRIAQIEVAIDDEKTALIFRNLDPLCDSDTQHLKTFAQQQDIAVYLQPGGPDSIVPLWPEDGVDLFYRLPDFDVEIHFQPWDFTQVNTEINRDMVARVIDLLDLSAEDHVLDLFCGLGNFTLPIARRAAQVIGIEGDPGLVKRAAENATRNGLDNVEFQVIDLAQEEMNFSFMQKAYDKLLLDPPRSGAQEILQQMDLSSLNSIVYVSCNPATLARDTEILVKQKGFRLSHAGVMDMFPHTAHVESIARFTR